MRTALLVLLLTSCVVEAARPAVASVNSANWEEKVNNKKKAAVLYFTTDSEWCTACKEGLEQFTKAAKAFKNERTVVFATVNVLEAADEAAKYDIDALPHILVFPKGAKNAPSTYTGLDDPKELVKFVNEKAKTSVTEPAAAKGRRQGFATQLSPVTTLTDATFKAATAKRDSFIMFMAPWCGHCKRQYPTFEEVALKFKDQKNVLIAKVDANKYRELGNKFDVKGFPTYKFISKGVTQDVAASPTVRGFVRYLNEKTGSTVVPPPPTEEERLAELPSNVTVLTDENFDSIAMDPNKHVIVEFYAPWCGHCKMLTPIYEQVALAYQPYANDVVIAKVDATVQTAVAARFEIKGYPTIKFFSKSSKEPQEYSGGRDLLGFIEYLNTNTGLNVEAPLPDEEQDPNSSVYNLSDKEFAKIVNDPSKDVLVEFYAPWCGHCKMLTPTYEELGKAFADSSDVVIAKIDATKHTKSAKSNDVSGFPTIKLFTKTNKAGIDYNGPRTLEGMRDFIKSGGSA